MITVFVDTSAFYAMLDGGDPDHDAAHRFFVRAGKEGWKLATTSYVVHESWALIQHRLGWDALEAFEKRLLPLCRIHYVDERLHERGAARCRQARRRDLSLTDCVSFEFARTAKIHHAAAFDRDFANERLHLPPG